MVYLEDDNYAGLKANEEAILILIWKNLQEKLSEKEYRRVHSMLAFM